MVQVVQSSDTWGPVFQGLGKGVSEGYMQQADEKALRQAVADLKPDASARDILNAITGAKTYSPKAKQNMFENMLGAEQFEELKRQHKAQEKLEGIKAGKKDQEKIDEAKGALKIIEDMRQIGARGRLGRGSDIISSIPVLGYSTAKDYGEYETLGKSLIQMSSNIPIRNRQEFEVLAHNIYDPTLSDAQREGVLNALEKIIQSSMQERSSGQPSEAPSSIGVATPDAQRPPLSSFERG